MGVRRTSEPPTSTEEDTVNANEWTQIHTNGADSTFARIYEYQRADLTKVWVFEKVNVDHVNGTNEVFGEEVLDNQYAAERRLRSAVNGGF